MESENATAVRCAEMIWEEFRRFQKEFDAITLRAAGRFHDRNWKGAHGDVVERIELYKRRVNEMVAPIRRLADRVNSAKSFGREMKKTYLSLIKDREDTEPAKTFYNSVTRRVFSTIGVNPEMEFVDADFEVPSIDAGSECATCFERPDQGSIRDLVREVLEPYRDEIDFLDFELDLDLSALEINSRLRPLGMQGKLLGIESLPSVFYRNKAAYIIGRINFEFAALPLVFALLNEGEGITLDAVLLSGEEITILFSFTRSYFRVYVDRPHAMVQFLSTLLPNKPVSELYTAIGFHKHGKAELYRELRRHLEGSQDRFITAPGEKGMVMVVFTLQSLDVVFKVIKDRFDYPKTMSRQTVRDKYLLVFRHDRAGRMVDAQEFEYLEFARWRFSPDLLAELRQVATKNVVVDADRVVLKHVYTERRITPLDIFIRKAGKKEAREAVEDYGNAVKELAATNIFPGDLFLKNFGVTRHGRVVFYDYDEICLLTDCNFRKMPPPRNYEDEMAEEPWYFVEENDVFPEEFKKFVGLPAPLAETFNTTHADLLGIGFWQEIQKKLKAGEVIDIFPYRVSRRFRRTGPAPPALGAETA